MAEVSLAQDEFERLMFFESTREKAEADFLRSPRDAENLKRWGAALLELAQFRDGQESIDMVEDAVSKLEEALQINPKKPDTLWCLGNAHTSHGFLLMETEKAEEQFRKASECFKQASEQEPSNELYRKALEMSEKAPAIHIELQKQLNAMSGSASGSTFANSTKGSKKKKEKKKKEKKKKENNDLKYDVLGWITLTVGVILWVGMAKSSVQAPPPNF